MKRVIAILTLRAHQELLEEDGEELLITPFCEGNPQDWYEYELERLSNTDWDNIGEDDLPLTTELSVFLKIFEPVYSNFKEGVRFRQTENRTLVELLYKIDGKFYLYKYIQTKGRLKGYILSFKEVEVEEKTTYKDGETKEYRIK